ncbi:MAG: hypothetical protein ABIX01_08115 [Chitinophagaceae bacterium]
MKKRIILLTIVDIVVVAVWAFCLNHVKVNQGTSMALILIIPILILLSGIWGLALKWAKYQWAEPVLINVAIACAIFYVIYSNEVGFG